MITLRITREEKQRSKSEIGNQRCIVEHWLGIMSGQSQTMQKTWFDKVDERNDVKERMWFPKTNAFSLNLFQRSEGYQQALK